MSKFIILILFSFLISCNKNTVFTEYESIPDNKWQQDHIVNFTYKPKDTLSKNTVFINLRNNKDYNFNNLFLIATVEFPNKTKVIDTLEYEMTDAKGYFLGDGFTDLKENKLEYKSNITFALKGNYHFYIQHAMRRISEENGVDYLNGITDVGIEIEKTIK